MLKGLLVYYYNGNNIYGVSGVSAFYRKIHCLTSEFYRKIHCLTSEFHVKFHARNRYRTNREAMSAISVFQVKFNVEFTRQVVNFS